MATVGGTLRTLGDHAKERDPKGNSAKIVELLAETNEIVLDALFKEGNMTNGDQQSQRTGLPTTYYGKMNMGIPNSKSTSVQVQESCAELVSRSQIDVRVANLDGDVKNARMNEGKAHLESMEQKFSNTMFYGSAVNPEEFIGLANRYSSTTAGNGQNIILGGGSGSDNTSIYLAGWSDNGFYCIYPKGTKAGLQQIDRGIQEVQDGDGNYYSAYVDYWHWNAGIMLKDWRYVVRIPNIDVSDLIAGTGTQATTASTFITKLMARAIHRIPSKSAKLCFYVNRTTASMLTVLAQEKSNAVLNIEEGLNQFGKSIFTLKFLGIPVRICDQITEAESLVS